MTDDLPPWVDAHAAGVARAGMALHRVIMAEMDQRFAKVEDRLLALERERVMRPTTTTMDQVIHEAEAGEWRPWEWAEALDMSEAELVRRLERQARRH